MSVAPELKTDQRATVWTTACELGTFTRTELAERSGIHIASVGHMVSCWARDGHLTSDGARRDEKLTVVTVNGPRFSSKDKRMWQTMRSHSVFSTRDIAVWSSMPEDQVSLAEAGRFMRMLLDAGYIRQRGSIHKDRHATKFLLVKNTGPKPPQPKRVHCVFDPNTDELTPNSTFRKAAKK